MIEIKKKSILCADAQELISELNQILIGITGDNGTAHFSNQDVEGDRSFFLIAYLDGIPYGCVALREYNDDAGEIKRVYARRNTIGIGTKMIKELERMAKELGYKKLVISTKIQNKHAIEFYSRLGYKHIANFGVYIGKNNSYCFEKLIP